MRVPAARNVKLGCLAFAICRLACAAGEVSSPTSIFAPASTPARSIFDLAVLILVVTGTIFLVVCGMLAYAAVKFRSRPGDRQEPLQIYGSDQLELAWTVIPVLIVIVLFMTSARVIHAVQDADRPPGTIEVTVIGHQFWWEYRYPQYGFVTANELHVPVSDPAHPTPTFLQLLSADTDHSFWVPAPGRQNGPDPESSRTAPGSIPIKSGSFSASARNTAERSTPRCCCASWWIRATDFDRWVHQQQQSQLGRGRKRRGRGGAARVQPYRMHQLPHDCGDGWRTDDFGPDLTHLMSRDTIASGVARNNAANLRRLDSEPGRDSSPDR